MPAPENQPLSTGPRAKVGPFKPHLHAKTTGERGGVRGRTRNYASRVRGVAPLPRLPEGARRVGAGANRPSPPRGGGVGDRERARLRGTEQMPTCSSPVPTAPGRPGGHAGVSPNTPPPSAAGDVKGGGVSIPPPPPTSNGHPPLPPLPTLPSPGRKL